MYHNRYCQINISYLCSVKGKGWKCAARMDRRQDNKQFNNKLFKNFTKYD